MAHSPKTLEFFRKIKAQQLTIATEAILQSTIQFYYNKESGRLAPCGSGVLLTIENRFFVATAAHVLATHSHSTFVALSDAELTLGGLLHSTPPSTFDLSVLELTDASQVARLQQEYSFLTLADLCVRQKHLNDLYLIVGYPATKTKVYNSTIHAKPYPLQAQVATDFNFAAEGLQRATHLVLDATGEVVSVANPNPHKTPDLRGVSGGGVWHNGNYLKGDPAQEKRLVGIIIEQRNHGRGGRCSLVVTRTAVLLEFMRQSFNLAIPASKTVKLNLGTGRPVAASPEI